MNNDLEIMRDAHFKDWIIAVKKKIKASQIKAAIQVNSEMIRLYWEIGKDVEKNRLEAKWGSGFYKSASKALRMEVPDLRGFSVTNLKYMRRFYTFYSSEIENRQQLVDDLKRVFSIPWGHQILLITKCNDVEEAMFYISKTLANGW